jgi:hypothetical protein
MPTKIKYIINMVNIYISGIAKLIIILMYNKGILLLFDRAQSKEYFIELIGSPINAGKNVITLGNCKFIETFRRPSKDIS